MNHERVEEPNRVHTDKLKVVIVKSTSINLDVRIDIEAEILAEAGYDVVVLGWDREGKYPKVEKRANYTIHRVRLKAPTQGNRIKIIFYWPIWWCAEFLWLLKNKYDILHAQNFDTIIPALVAAKIKRKNLIYGIRDIYSDSVSSMPKWVRQIALCIDNFFIKSADGVIFANAPQLELIGKNLNDNSIVICNAPKNAPCISEHGKNDKFTLFFGGSIYKKQISNLDKIIMAVKDIDDIRLVIAGYGDYEGELIEIIKDIKNVDFIGAIEYKEVLNRTLNADLLFVLYDPGLPNNASCLTHKMFEAMACGKPILVSDATAMADFVRAHNCGVVVNCRSVKEIRDAIVKLKDNPQLCRQLGANGKRAYEEKYSWQIMKPRLLDFYEKIYAKIKRCSMLHCVL